MCVFVCFSLSLSLFISLSRPACLWITRVLYVQSKERRRAGRRQRGRRQRGRRLCGRHQLAFSNSLEKKVFISYITVLLLLSFVLCCCHCPFAVIITISFYHCSLLLSVIDCSFAVLNYVIYARRIPRCNYGTSKLLSGHNLSHGEQKYECIWCRPVCTKRICMYEVEPGVRCN